MIDYQYVLATIARDSSARGWNVINDPETGEKLAEWMLGNPYTGPATASDPTEEWVHYCNGGLKIRYREPVGEEWQQKLKSALRESGKTLQDVLAEYPEAPDFEALAAEVVNERKYGVRYAVPAEEFQSAQALQDYVATKVTEFIETRDSYYMAEGDSYPWGKSMGK